MIATATAPDAPAAPPARRSLADVSRRRFNRAAAGARGAFEAAADDRFHSVHFANASNIDAAGAIRADLQTLRNRCRYESQQNGYARGMIETHANDAVGSGPRLQMQTADADLNARLENEWAAFAAYLDDSGQLDMAAILRAVDGAQFHTGSALLILTADPAADTPLALRVQMVEADRLATPAAFLGDADVRDGIRFDPKKKNRPQSYYILDRHPGDFQNLTGGFDDYKEVPADRVIHVFRTDRPGQTTAVPWLTTALTPLADLRDYSRAVTRAAHRAACISGTMETASPDVDADETSPAEMEEIELPEDSMLTLPAQWKFNQVKPEQPAATFAEFKAEKLREIGRPVSMPFNIIAGYSGGYNYASGRLDWQLYFRHIRTVQDWYGRLILDAILREFVNQCRLLAWFKPAWRRLVAGAAPHRWFWPGFAHVDPTKEAAAQAVRLASNTTTLAEEYAAQGKDWERELTQRAKELAFIADLEAAHGIKMTTADIVPAGSIIAAELVGESQPAAAPAATAKKTGGKTNAA